MMVKIFHLHNVEKNKEKQMCVQPDSDVTNSEFKAT